MESERKDLDAYEGPVIILKSVSSDYYILFFCHEYNDEWYITSINRLLSGTGGEEYFIPESVIIPWL
jgi:hypothetical protein